MNYILLIIGFVMLVKGADIFINGSSSIAKRLNITIDDMKNMSFVSLMNILLSTIEESETKGTESDVRRFFG